MRPEVISGIACDLCGAAPRETLFMKHGLAYSRCPDCGFVYASTRLASFEEYNDAGTEERHERYAAKHFDVRTQRDFARVLRQFRGFRQTGRFLDLGCNVGGMVLAARHTGWTAIGVEPSASVARYGQERHGLDIRPSTLEQAGLAPDSFDVIYSNAVLEHLASPRAVLKSAWGVLRPGGMIWASTVNLASYTGEHLGASWHLVDPRAHLSLFSPETLTRFFRETGFEVLRVRTSGVRFLSREAGRPKGWAKLLDGLRKLPYSAAARWNGKGDRITILARKPAASKTVPRP